MHGRYFPCRNNPINTYYSITLTLSALLLSAGTIEASTSMCTRSSETLGSCLGLCANKPWKDCEAGVGFWPRDIPSSCFLANKWNLEHRMSTVSRRHNGTDLLWCYFSFMVIWHNWITASISAVLCFLFVDRRQITWCYLYLYRIQNIFFLLYNFFKSN